MKIIFLDIDGVLNSEEWLDKRNDNETINPEQVKLLKEIVDRTGAEIVLSSTWRALVDTEERQEHPQYTYLVDSLKKFGLKIKSHTPRIGNDRPMEIKEWIDKHGTNDEIKFVILDDDFPIFWYQIYGISDCLVQTSYHGKNGGLQKGHVEKAVKILNEE